MTWRAAGSLLVLQQQLQAGAPRAAPPATDPDAWGLIGDALHDPNSDHSPKDFPGWGDDIVTAEDFPHAPELGLDSRAVCEDIRRSRDDRVKYMISQDQICSSYATSSRPAWAWGPYNPGDPNRDRHDTHAHVSVVGDARADDTRPWATIGGEEEDDMGGYGPVVMPAELDSITLTVPPVGGTPAVPGPAEVWLNFGVDFSRSKWRIYVGNGGGSGAPAAGTDSHGLVLVDAFRVFSSKLPVGTRLISIMRQPLDDGAPYRGPVVFNYEVGK